jgi:exodeoxyribonuclease V alpha subunit
VANLKVKVLKRIFLSEESGYGVFKTNVQGTRESTIIVGNLFDVNEGDFLELEGDFTQHPRFGEQFKVKSFQSVLPQDKDGIIKYLSSGRIKGIGARLAERIVDYFGDDVFEILEKYPDRLKEVKGIRKKVIEELKESSSDNKIIRDLTVKLSPHGIGRETIFKIFKEFDADAMDVLKTNPFVLIERIRGVGFRIADTVAKSFGLANNDPFRIMAGIDFLVTNLEQKNGDLYADQSDLIQRAASLLDVADTDVAACIDTMVESNKLVREEIPEPVLLSYKNFAIEKMSAQMLFNLSQSSSNLDPVEVDFDYLFQRTAVQLTDEQQQAVVSAVNNRITVITGGPGTGKTTIIRAIIDSLEKENKSVLIAAPTGRAAKRIDEATQYQASTIHRMLKINPENRQFVHNEQNPLKADAIIVDEFSMVDCFIFFSLLKAISLHTRLIIIGDKDQLPSVGPGNVLRDIISCDFFDVIYLNRNFRQDQDSLIIDNAYRINNGENLIFKPYSDDLDFVFIRVTNEQQAKEKVLNILNYYKDDYHFNSPDFQVLVPMYRGDAGIDNLNRQIQESFNPRPPYAQKDKIQYKQWDKVMQLKNNYEKEIFNGEQGIITDFNADHKTLIIDFDGNCLEYTLEELEEITLSYSVSVHKAQGSEYDMMALVLLPSHAIMLNRELFYTAVTRAKKKIFLISDPQTIHRAIHNASPSQRKTLLKKRLQEIFEPLD